MKKCGKCGETKARSEFHKNRTKKDGLRNMCKDCSTGYQRQYYKRKPKKYNQHNRRNYLRNKEFVDRYRRLCICKECGESKWYVLDFHHIKDKDTEVSTLVRNQASIERIKNEIRKCEVLCANCHREKHYLERMAL